MTFVGIVSVVSGVLALMVWAKTKRPGMAIGVIIGGGIVIAAKDTAVMTSVGTAVGTVITNVANALPCLMGG